MLGVRPISNVTDGFVGRSLHDEVHPGPGGCEHPRSVPQRQHPGWDAIESVPPGHVIVVDSRGDTRAASGGDMLMTRAWKRGVAGFVTDGGLRDGHVLSQLPFPTYAAPSRSPPGPRGTTWPTSRCPLDVPVLRCTPATCRGGPGRDVVIPRALAGEIAEPALEQEKLEAYVAIKIVRGTAIGARIPQRANHRRGQGVVEGVEQWHVSAWSWSEAGSAGSTPRCGPCQRRRGRHRGGPHQPPPVPAPALSGGDGDPAAWVDRARASRGDHKK